MENQYREKEVEEEKRNRLAKAEMRKEKFQKTNQKKLLQGKITESLKKLPENEIELFLREEKKKRKMDLKEVKQNLWRKWRKNGEPQQEKEEDMEKTRGKLARLEETLENW